MDRSSLASNRGTMARDIPEILAASRRARLRAGIRRTQASSLVSTFPYPTRRPSLNAACWKASRLSSLARAVVIRWRMTFIPHSVSRSVNTRGRCDRCNSIWPRSGSHAFGCVGLRSPSQCQQAALVADNQREISTTGRTSCSWSLQRGKSLGDGGHLIPRPQFTLLRVTRLVTLLLEAREE